MGLKINAQEVIKTIECSEETENTECGRLLSAETYGFLQSEEQRADALVVTYSGCLLSVVFFKGVFSE